MKKILVLAALGMFGLVSLAQAQGVALIRYAQDVPVYFRFVRSPAVPDSSVISFTGSPTTALQDTSQAISLIDAYWKIGNSWWNGGTLGSITDTIPAFSIEFQSPNSAAITGADSLDTTIQTSPDGYTWTAVDTVGVGAVIRPSLATNPQSLTQFWSTYGGLGTDRINWYNANFIRLIVRLDPNALGSKFRVLLKKWYISSN